MKEVNEEPDSQLADPLSATEETPTDRICEECRGSFPANIQRWYVDPEGVELCPECADDLRATWALEGFSNA